MSLQPVRGTYDLMEDEARKFRHIVNVALSLADNYGFEQLETPIFEFTDVFKRTLGDTTDIVTKEMYTFDDKGGDSITLRPEGTAGIARAFISNGLSQKLPLKLLYHGPMFRYERPQKGRYRQFHQLGVELLGVDSPLADIECISLADSWLNKLGLRSLAVLEINTIGDSESRANYRKKLVEFLTEYEKELSPESQQRLKANPLRVLDSKDPKDQRVAKMAPKIHDTLNDASRAFFDQVQNSLSQMGISYEINPHLVRGIDYYTHTVFEYRTTHLGAQDAILAGGRYDHLIETMGGPATPGVGWAAGLERLSLLMKSAPVTRRPAALIPLGEAAERELLKWAHELRAQGLPIELSFGGNLSKRMKKANRANARYALIVGDDELAKGQVQLKDLDSGAQSALTIKSLKEQLEKLL